jgi:ATP-binding cassette subfamily B protein
MSNGTKRPVHGPGHGPMAVEKAKDFKGTSKKLLTYVSKYKISLFIVIIFAIASTIFSILGPKILGNATTELYTGLISKISGGDGINFSKIGKILLFLLCLYIISAIFSYIQGFIMSGVSQKLTYNLRNQLSEKIHKLPFSYFDTKTNGEVLSVITNDIDTLSQSLNQTATQFVTSITTIIGVLVMMFSINVTMTILSLIILPISGICVSLIVSKSQKHFKKQQEYLGHVNGNVEEMYSGYTVIKAFNAEDKMLNEFNYNNKKLYETGWKSQFLSGIMQPIMNFIGNIGYVMVAIVGGYYAILGKITVGNIQSFIQYNKQFTQPIAQLAQVSNMIQSMVAAAERVFEFLEEKEEEKIINPVLLDNPKGNVEFKNVSFGYDDNIIIKNFNAKIKAGSKIAIVGPTGAGKTTIVKLLLRFYRVNSGEIKIDGVNVNNLSDETFKNLFGMVLQDTWLFSGTIMENLRYGNLNATDDEVIDSAKAAHVHHFIQTLSDGYNMVLNEESNNISGGQKQLLTIARTILSNPKILILDEATSSVDTRTEILIQNAMDEVMKGRTTFIIAHRLSTIRNADMILVMDHGDIIEQGTHEELLAKDGFYAKLYNSQFETV